MLSKTEGEILLSARDRWASDARLRRMHRCTTDNPDDNQYKAKLALYLRAVAKNFADNRPGGSKFDEIRDGDPISRILANPSMIVRQ